MHLENYSFYLNLHNFITIVDPTDNPECQSFADIINEIKKNFDRIPLNLLPIPGLDTTKPTTLQCYEFANCTGFNCSGQVYGTHIQFSFDMDYCAKPIKAYLTVSTNPYVTFD